MADQDLYRGMIRIHVLHHAAHEVIFGLGMMRELQRHGYRIGPGTLYPILHGLAAKGYLRPVRQVVRNHRVVSRPRQQVPVQRAPTADRLHRRTIMSSTPNTST